MIARHRENFIEMLFSSVSVVVRLLAARRRPSQSNKLNIRKPNADDAFVCNNLPFGSFQVKRGLIQL
jgi:hypothetical protein